ncbi:MAG TPA: hypothetical protein VGF76_07270 [Polyangiaceae bacterium]|jgi:hypothetical protein
MILYRPVGVGELRLIVQSGFREFPPRLPGQPIFYPVLTREYARRIARDWNTVDAESGFAGFVTEFEIDAVTAQRYPVQLAGGHSHEELWIPADELAEFNTRMVGIIRVVEAFTGSALLACSTHRLSSQSILILPAIPEADLRACLAVLGRACVHARLLGYEGRAGAKNACEDCKADRLEAFRFVSAARQRVAGDPSGARN